MTHGYDVIGDVHGEATKLKGLLQKMEYVKDADGVYRHEDRKAVFVGDLVDRGSEQLETLRLVKAMVDAGTAYMVLGNHEFNALAWATDRLDIPGKKLRDNEDVDKSRQHEAFLKQLDQAQRDEYLAWFLEIPLWLELDGLRVIHACWNQEIIDVAKTYLPNGKITSDFLQQAALKPQREAWESIDRFHPYWMVEVLLKGPEVPVSPAFITGKLKDGAKEKHRHHARLKWWMDYNGGDKRQYLSIAGYLAVDGTSPYEPESGELSDDYQPIFYSDEKPVVFGHYWMRGEPRYEDTFGDHAACVDFSVAAQEGGRMTAYRFNMGDTKILAENFIQFEAAT